MLDDVLVVLQRAEMTTRMAERDRARTASSSASEGRLIRDAAGRARSRTCPREKAAIVCDYQADRRRPGRERWRSRRLRRAAAISELLEFDQLAALLGLPARASNPIDHTVAPRGYRVLSHIPRPARARSSGTWSPTSAALDADRAGDAARSRGGRGRRRGARPGDPRGPAAAAGAQPRRPVPPTSSEQRPDARKSAVSSADFR